MAYYTGWWGGRDSVVRKEAPKNGPQSFTRKGKVKRGK